LDPRSRNYLVLSSLAELETLYQNSAGEDRDLPEDVLWLDGSVTIAGGFAEKWYAVGGPEIYHDSFTFSVFSRDEIFPSLLEAADETCASGNARLEGVYEGRSLGWQ
jgi:hypothetical protein